MKIKIPDLSLVILIGSSGSGKTTFANKHFKETEIISSDFCRKLLSDNENDQSVTSEAFEVLHFLAAKRLAIGKLTVIDATNVQENARKSLIQVAKDHNCFPIAIVLNMPERVCHERNKNRHDRTLGDHVIKKHINQLHKSLRGLHKEGFKDVFIFNHEKEVNELEIIREPLYNNLKHEHGPFDIIGDIHGCYDELHLLLEKLGYVVNEFHVKHPYGRKLVFLGDLVDRGPKSVEVLKLVMNAVKSGNALCVPGNHDIKLLKKLNGRNVSETHGLEVTLKQLEQETDEFKEEVRRFIDGLISHYVLNDGLLVVAHAGMKKEYQGRGSGKVREFALYGETTGETDEYGLPVRLNWASLYRGDALVVYGHTPNKQVYEMNQTINIDTGCVFGGSLTALKYPEKEYVSVEALKMYYEPAKPLFIEETERIDDTLDIKDVLGKKIIQTRLLHNITIQEENSIAALEVMGRYAADPHYLIYLPPTMSPSETSKLEGMLEHPLEAFSYYQNRGVKQVVCEQKHMGSRAVVIICKDKEVAAKRFKVSDHSSGICYTRTGRHFFNDQKLEEEFLMVVRKSLDNSNFWSDFDTDWVCLDCELMPWSSKAQSLIKNQFAPVGVSSTHATSEALELIQKANQLSSDKTFTVNSSGENTNLSELLSKFNEMNQCAHQYVDAYQGYCWDVNDLSDYKLAPFHILATEGKVHVKQNHLWHMEMIKQYLVNEEQTIISTNYLVVDVNDLSSIQLGINWWETLTQNGGEGMVVKPLDFIVNHANELVQPAIKCRGKEYLRIIYGPLYTMKVNMKRLKNRSLGRKRFLALREFSLGIEALERFVNHEPLYKIHECVFGVLALESEPIDPRL